MTHRASSRERILQTAKELFYHHGFQMTSIDDILRASGVSRSNFYYHFPSKQALILTVIEQRVTEFETVLLQSLQNRQISPANRLTRFFEQICQMQEQARMAGCPFGNMTASLPTGTGNEQYERYRQALSRLFHRIEEAMRDCLTEGVHAGQFRNDLSPAAMAAFLVASLQGLLIVAKAHQNTGALLRGLSVALHLLRLPDTPEAPTTPQHTRYENAKPCR